MLVTFASGKGYEETKADNGREVQGVCYGAQYIAQKLGGNVSASDHREYGRAMLNIHAECKLMTGLSKLTQVWMSHADTITELPANAVSVAGTDSIPYAAYRLNDSETYCIQFHPEVTHSLEGRQLLS